MTDQFMSIFLGGIVAAVLLDIGGVLQKASNQAGIGTGSYLVTVGVSVIVVGGLFWLIQGNSTANAKSVSLSVVFGVIWTLAIGLVAIAVTCYNGQISQIVPLYNTKTLVAVLLGSFVLSEISSMNIPRLLIGSVLTILGDILAATARL